MASLVSLHAKSGKCLAVCNALCYAGTGDRCNCLCGGINHGVGLQTAAAQTLSMKLFDPRTRRPLELNNGEWIKFAPNLSALAKQPMLFEYDDRPDESIDEQLHGN